MRWIAIAMAGVLGCTTSPPVDDAGPAPQSTSFDQPIGAACKAEESALCAGGLGVCHTGVCRAFCAVTALPRCPAGTVEVHDQIGEREICVCAPR
jgi:hypothetical protein